jgi:hypothetical protein
MKTQWSADGWQSGRPDKERAHRPQRWRPIATDEEAMPLHWPRHRHHPSSDSHAAVAVAVCSNSATEARA